MNTLIRQHVLKKGGAVDKWISLGHEGCRELMKRYFSTFSFDELDLPEDLRQRGVDDPEKLPNYFFRDDGLRLWDAVSTYAQNMLGLFYKSNDDVIMDTELQSWIQDIHVNGFHGYGDPNRLGLPTRLDSLSCLTQLATKVIFMGTCYHSATHSEALDLYGFLPLVPGMMRKPPPHKRGLTNRELIVKTLPDQSPEAYYGSLANVLQQCPPDEVCDTMNPSLKDSDHRHSKNHLQSTKFYIVMIFLSKSR